MIPEKSNWLIRMLTGAYLLVEFTPDMGPANRENNIGGTDYRIECNLTDMARRVNLGPRSKVRLAPDLWTD